MKKYILVGIVFIIFFSLVFLFLRNNRNSEIPVSPDSSNSATVIPEENKEGFMPQDSTSNEYSLSYIIVRNPDKIKLISNLEKKLSSQEALKEYSCQYLTSAGFFGENGEHLGYFDSGEGPVRGSSNSTLLNGYFYTDSNKKASIKISLPPLGSPNFAIQSGPMIITNKLPNNVISANQENARRVIAAITEKNEVAFIVLYLKSSPLLGPVLDEVPELLADIRKNTNLKIVDAINLDGGSHSAFYGDTVKLSEVSTPGSYFCITP